MHPNSNPLGEFDLIKRFFKTEIDLSATNPAVNLGIGDDCALIKPSPGEEIAITSDMLVEGRHFFADASPEQLGRKALAVNLSDLAAMGAKPLGFTLAIAMPAVNTEWLEAFSKGLLAIAKEFACPLIGGDTTAGPLTLSITAIGSIPMQAAIRRSGAQIGDDIWVSGAVGDARLALAALRHEVDLSKEDYQLIAPRLHQPTPRIRLGLALRGIASAALDVSDGLLGDLMHILKQSKVAAEINLTHIPKSPTLQKQNLEIQHQFAASGGDDYELCFTAPHNQRAAILEISKQLHIPLTQIGHIIPAKDQHSSLFLKGSDGRLLASSETSKLLQSFDHFAK